MSLFKYIFRDKLHVFITWILLTVQVISEMCIPFLMSIIIDSFIPLSPNTALSSSEQTYQDLFFISTIMFLCIVLFFAVGVAGNYIACLVSTNVGHYIREKVYTKSLNLSPITINNISPGSIITMCTNDIQTCQQTSIVILRCVLCAPLDIAIGLIACCLTCPNIVWIPVLISLFIICFCIILVFSTYKKFTKIQELLDKINSFISNSIKGIFVIKAFNKENHFANKFSNINTNITELLIFNNTVLSLVNPITIMTINLGTVLVLLFGSINASTLNISIGQLMAFITYCTEVFLAFMYIGISISSLPRADVAINRIEKIIKQKNNSYSKKYNDYSRTKNAINFKDVSFAYNQKSKNIINKISFEISQGEICAIVGPTGSGKTTLLKLIDGFYKPDKGDIYIYGNNISLINPKYISKNISFALQNDFIFSGTIRNNIDIKQSLDNDDQINKAVKISQCHTFINAMSNGLESKLNSAGSNLSGGQKSRICISRALSQDPRILLMDNTTSSLDAKTEYLLISEIISWARKNNKTLLIVSERLCNINNVDKIFVLENGELVAQGSHEQLIKDCKSYKELNKIQKVYTLQNEQNQ